MLDRVYLESIKGFEGFAQQAKWDYAQNTNGFGTRALFQGEIISPAEAHRRFASEIKTAAEIVDRFAPNVSEGTRAALTSLTFNAGTAWTKSGLGKAIASGDIETARQLFLQYNKAGGEVLPGLVARRAAESTWFEARPTDGQIADLSKTAESSTSGTQLASIRNNPAKAPVNGSAAYDLPQLETAIIRGDTAPAALGFADLRYAIFDLMATFIHEQDKTRTKTSESRRDNAITSA